MPKKDLSKTVESVLERIDQRRSHPTGTRSKLPYGCDKCDGFGNVITEHGARLCECKLTYLTQVRLRRANIPDRFIKKTLANFETPSQEHKKILAGAKEYVEKYSKDNNRGILLIGGAGIGKTHLAVGILRELILKGFNGIFFNMNDLLDELKRTFDPDVEIREQDILDDLIGVDVLVLDDVGAQEKVSAYVLDRFYTLVNGRYQADKTLIVTTNLDLSALEMRLSKRTISRLYEMCKVEPVLIDHDYRQETHNPTLLSRSNRARGDRKRQELKTQRDE